MTSKHVDPHGEDWQHSEQVQHSPVRMQFSVSSTFTLTQVLCRHTLTVEPAALPPPNSLQRTAEPLALQDLHSVARITLVTHREQFNYTEVC